MIVGSVVAFHVAAIWALQSGLVRKAAEVIVPAELLSEFIAPPAPPKVAPPPPALAVLDLLVLLPIFVFGSVYVFSYLGSLLS